MIEVYVAAAVLETVPDRYYKQMIIQMIRNIYYRVCYCKLCFAQEMIPKAKRRLKLTE